MPPHPAPHTHPQLLADYGESSSLRSLHPQARSLIAEARDWAVLDCLYLLASIEHEHRRRGLTAPPEPPADPTQRRAWDSVTRFAAATGKRATRATYRRWLDELGTHADQEMSALEVESALGGWPAIREKLGGPASVAVDVTRRQQRSLGRAFSRDELLFQHRLCALELGVLAPAMKEHKNQDGWAKRRLADHGEYISIDDMRHAAGALVGRPEPVAEQLRALAALWMKEDLPFDQMRIAASTTPFRRLWSAPDLQAEAGFTPAESRERVTVAPEDGAHDGSELLELLRELDSLARADGAKRLSSSWLADLRRDVRSGAREAPPSLRRWTAPGQSIVVPSPGFFTGRFGSFLTALERAGIIDAPGVAAARRQGVWKELALDDLWEAIRFFGRDLSAPEYDAWRKTPEGLRKDGSHRVCSGWLANRFGWPEARRMARRQADAADAADAGLAAGETQSGLPATTLSSQSRATC